MFVDDKKICREMINTLDCIILQVDLNNIQKWLEQWQMKYKSTKCKVMYLGNANDRPK